MAASKPNLLFEECFEIFQSKVDVFVPFKQKNIPYNNNSFKTNSVRNEIMIRSKLCNKFNKSRTIVNQQNYKKQGNKCVKALNHTKKLNSKSITDTKKFWMTVKVPFSNKSKAVNTIIFHENHRIIKDNKKISHTLNKCFTNLTKTLKLKQVYPALKTNLNSCSKENAQFVLNRTFGL